MAHCLPCPGYMSLPSPVGRADLHGIPQLVGQIVRADAIGEALRQEDSQEPGKRWDGRAGSHPFAPISSSGFRCEGPGERPPAPPPGLPLQAPVGGGAAAPGRPGAELLGAQWGLNAGDICHSGFLPLVPREEKRGRKTRPARLRRLQRGIIPSRKDLLPPRTPPASPGTIWFLSDLPAQPRPLGAGPGPGSL